MGDADGTQIRMSVEEVEEWMDEALSEMDDGLDNLISLMNTVNDRTVKMMSEINSLQRFRRCFTALNLFAVPIVLSIGIAYGTVETLTPNSSIDTALQMLVMFLMYVSGFIGFPLYVLNLWRTYCAGNRTEKTLTNRTQVTSRESGNQDGRIAVDAVENVVPLPFVEETSEILSELQRRFNVARNNVRSTMERRINQLQAQVQPTSTQATITSRHRESLIDLDSNSSPDPAGTLSEIIRREMFQKDDNGVKVFILNATQDLSVEIENEGETFAETDESGRESEKNKLFEISNAQQSGNHKTAAKSVAEADYRYVPSKDVDSLGFKGRASEQIFGL